MSDSNVLLHASEPSQRDIAPRIVSLALFALAIPWSAPHGAIAQPMSQSVRFGRRPAQVGDQVQQTIEMETRLNTTWRQGSEIVEKSVAATCSRQRRVVTTNGVAQGRPQAVLVRYLEATRRLEAGDAQAAAHEDAPPLADADKQPVAGKTYRCRRDGERLIVTDEHGGMPTLAEFEIVAADMEAIGRPSPLAEFLNGRTVRVGETLLVPAEVAERLLGVGEKFGQLDRFALTLREVRTEAGAACAVFQASVAAASHDASQMRLEIDGSMIVEIGSCRAVRISFAGPIGLSESRGTHGAAYQVFGTGRLSMSVASSYRDATR